MYSAAILSHAVWHYFLIFTAVCWTRLFFYVKILVNAVLISFLPTIAIHNFDFCFKFVTKFMEQTTSKMMPCLAVMWEDKPLLLAKQCFISSKQRKKNQHPWSVNFDIYFHFSVSLHFVFAFWVAHCLPHVSLKVSIKVQVIILVKAFTVLQSLQFHNFSTTTSAAGCYAYSSWGLKDITCYFIHLIPVRSYHLCMHTEWLQQAAEEDRWLIVTFLSSATISVFSH